MFYAINYRVKRIGRFKTTLRDSSKREETVKGQTFHNPIYDVNEAVQQAPGYSHENLAYEMTDDPDREKKMAQPDVYRTIENPVCDVNTVAKQKPGYSHENPAYQMSDDPDREI